MKTTGKWYLETTDGQTAAFFHDWEEKVSPLDRIEDFDGGDYWIIDAKLSGYREFPEDNSFVMVPKENVARVWFQRYTESNRPKAIGKSKTLSQLLGK